MEAAAAPGPAEPSARGGPRTPAGKLASRRNALRHGQTADALLEEIVGEAEYTRVLEAARAELRPGSVLEEELVSQIAHAILTAHISSQAERAQVRHLLRAARQALGSVRDEDGLLAEAVSSPRLALTQRYAAAAHGGLSRLLKQLFELQDLRRRGLLGRTSPGPAALTTPPTPPTAGAVAALRRRLADDAGAAQFLAESYTARGHGLTPLDPQAWLHPDPRAPQFVGTFLCHSGLARPAALRLALEWLTAPDVLLAALCEKAGLTPTRATQRLVRAIRAAHAARADWIVEALQRALAGSGPHLSAAP